MKENILRRRHHLKGLHEETGTRDLLHWSNSQGVDSVLDTSCQKITSKENVSTAHATSEGTFQLLLSRGLPTEKFRAIAVMYLGEACRFAAAVLMLR